MLLVTIQLNFAVKKVPLSIEKQRMKQRSHKSLFYKPNSFLLVSAAISHDQLNKIWELFLPPHETPKCVVSFWNYYIVPVKVLQSNYKCDYL